jgi:type II secretory pathway predicted ATPase ExeA
LALGAATRSRPISTLSGGRLQGTELPLFEPAAVEAIFQSSSGLPRKANALAHHALLAAAVRKAKSINTEHIHAAQQELA